MLGKRWQAVTEQALDVLYPPACLGCDSALTPAERSQAKRRMTNSDGLVCERCQPGTVERIVYDSRSGCSKCGSQERSTLSESRCLPCTLVPMGASHALSLWWYAGPVETLLKRYKYTWQPLLAEFLAAELTGFIRAAFPESPWDLVAAVPSSPQALRKRGFHHLGALSRIVARNLHTPADLLALRATHKAFSQAQLSPEDRTRNVQNAFSASRGVRGRSVLLLDDVITSGETIREASNVLLDAGAIQVTAATLARSTNFAILRNAVAMQNSQSRRLATGAIRV